MSCAATQHVETAAKRYEEKLQGPGAVGCCVSGEARVRFIVVPCHASHMLAFVSIYGGPRKNGASVACARSLQGLELGQKSLEKKGTRNRPLWNGAAAAAAGQHGIVIGAINTCAAHLRCQRAGGAGRYAARVAEKLLGAARCVARELIRRRIRRQVGPAALRCA